MSKLTVVSNGAGQDSATIIFKLGLDSSFRKKYAPNDLIVLFSDTDNEHPHTVDYYYRVLVPFMDKYKIPHFYIKKDMGFHGVTWQGLTFQWEHKNPTIGSVAYPKTCSHNLKLIPQYRYIEQYLKDVYNQSYGRKKGYKEFTKNYGKINWIIGIAKGEEKRIVDSSEIKEKWKQTSINTVYPLIDIEYTRQSCQNYIKSLNYELPFPSNCMYCPFGIGAFELLWLYKTYPDKFDEWADYEQKKLSANINETINHGVSGKLHKNGDRKNQAITLKELVKEYENKYPNVTLDQLNEFKFSHGHCVTSKY